MAMTTAEVAAEFGTDARTLRKFLRSEQGKGTKVGKGARWSIERRELRALRSRFTKWTNEADAAKADKAPEAPIAPEVDNTPDEG